MLINNMNKSNDPKYHSNYYKTHKQKMDERTRKWQILHPDQVNMGYKKARDLLLDEFGGVCVKCGFSDKRALQLDHINGEGTKHVNNMKGISTLNTYYSKHIDEAKEIFQLLCANCNWIKRHERKEYRKRKTDL